MGSISIISGIAASFLPETLNENLPQTIDDGDDFGRDLKYWALAKKVTNESEEEEGDRKRSLLKSNMNGNDVTMHESKT